MRSKNDNIEIMINNKVDEVIELLIEFFNPFIIGMKLDWKHRKK